MAEKKISGEVIKMAGWKKFAKKAEKKVFGSGGVKGRYGIGKGKGGFKIMQLAKDLEMVKSRLNVEKKFLDTDVITEQFAQVDYNVDGAFYRDITPLISQGVGESQRVGNSLKLTGLSMPIQFSGGANTLSARKIRVSLLKIKSADGGVTAQEAFEQVWDPNPLSGVRDYNCQRNYRNSKNDGISVIYSKSFYMRGPQLDNSAQGADIAERSQLCVRVNLKLKDILRYGTNASSAPDGIRYVLVMQTDLGNMSGASSSPLDVPVTNIYSEIIARVHTRWWYVDN